MGPSAHGGAAAVAVFTEDVWVSTRREAGPGTRVQIKEQSLFLQINAGKGVEKRHPFCTVDGTVN